MAGTLSHKNLARKSEISKVSPELTLAHLLAWSIQEEQTVFDLLSMPYYHPVLEETLEVALSNLAEKVEGHHPPLRGFKTLDNFD